jgi:hypothetical protein
LLFSGCRKPRGSFSRALPKSPSVSDSSKRKKTLEEEFWDNYKPPIPDLAKNRYLLVAGTLLATGSPASPPLCTWKTPTLGAM